MRVSSKSNYFLIIKYSPETSAGLNYNEVSSIISKVASDVLLTEIRNVTNSLQAKIQELHSYNINPLQNAPALDGTSGASIPLNQVTISMQNLQAIQLRHHSATQLLNNFNITEQAVIKIRDQLTKLQ